MSVRTKIFGLASSVAVFAGMAYGQALTCGTTATGAPSISPTNPIELRAEGATELVSDTITPCFGSTTGVIQGNVTAYITGSGVQGITSPLVPKQTYSEATLAITDTSGGGHGSVYYFGTITGSQVTFGTTAVPVLFPTYNFLIQISNVRVNVTGTYPNIPQPVTETVFAGAQGVAALFTVAPQTVGYIRDGLQVTGSSGSYIGAGSSTAGTAFGFSSSNGASTVFGGVGTPFSYLVCQSGSSQTQPGMAVTVTELFAGAFKTAAVSIASQQQSSLLAPPSANIPGSESGSLVGTITASGGAVATVGVANSGTRIKFVFNNVPANVTLGVPLSLSTANLQMNLMSNAETAAFVAQTATSNFGGLYSVPISGGSGVAIYEVQVANLTVIKSATLTVAVGFTANTVVAPSGPITVTTSYSPSPATPGAALPATLPTVPYFANTGTVLNGSTFTNCSTTLLFPFITNEAGFETGIAIANTALDTLGAAGKSVASGQTGACTIFFYGSTGKEGGTQPTIPTAPNFPAATLTPASIAPGTTHADTLTDVIGGPFQGYAIAVCPFLYARGFAFIEYGLATTSGVVEGYTADVLSANRLAGGVTAVSNNIPESSGQ
jgi:hypothetical protein